MSKLVTLAYGVVCYAFAMATILYSIGFIGGFAPKSIDTGMAAQPLNAVIINLALLGIFAVQHSVMARRAFKAWWMRIVPQSVERSTYVLFSAAALALLFWQWRPIGGTLWSTTGVLAGVLTAVFWVGWGIVFLSTFLINHFDLFGLAQVWSAARQAKHAPPTFRTPLLYKVMRHPIYFGFLLAFWGTPVMSYGHALFAGAASAYILIGIWLEERDLIGLFGQAYLDYRARVSMLIPLPPRRS